MCLDFEPFTAPGLPCTLTCLASFILMSDLHGCGSGTGGPNGGCTIWMSPGVALTILSPFLAAGLPIRRLRGAARASWPLDRLGGEVGGTERRGKHRLRLDLRRTHPLRPEGDPGRLRQPRMLEPRARGARRREPGPA